ncbi:hypothetical protein KM043_006501 [Ampulex compressa]|nr:hypothetical protein KM043_006501 [Ampulex compressa]
MDEVLPKTLYVGNLDHTVSEDLLCALFSHIGVVRGCKIIREAPPIEIAGGSVFDLGEKKKKKLDNFPRLV